jgi:putative heme-binding domain-containing protein
VRIELPGDSRTLTLAEVQVFADGRNVALGGTATQSTLNHDGEPQRAIDGDTNPDFSAGSQTHTVEDRPNPWWEVDLGAEFPIERIVVWNRKEGELGKRLDGFTLRVLDGQKKEVFAQTGIPAPDTQVEWTLSGDPAAAIRSAAIGSIVHLSPGEPSTFSALANLVLKNTSRTDAVRGLARLPRRSWVDRQIEPLVVDIVGHLAELTTSQRTQPPALDEISLARKLVTALPTDSASGLRKQLDELGVNVVVLRPVPHRMQYDRNQFFVEAGKPFQLVFDNIDIMPHNVVITAPGAYAKVGIAAEMMVTESGASGRAFIPNMPEVLYATNLLQPGQTQQLELIAPQQIGQYPYVCTYPGHWRRMYGVMHVVADLSEAPVEAFAPTVDSEIAMRPFVREWALADLKPDLEIADHSRSFEEGRALFTELSCIQCHRVGESEGGAVGPNLIEVREKLVKGELNREGILKSLVEPSSEIAEKFRTWIVQDIEGRVYTGVIAERTDDSIRLLANPLDNGEPVTIATDDIEEEIESKVSLMPAGLLNTCSKSEILDLLMFVESGGDPDHPAWSKQD